MKDDEYNDDDNYENDEENEQYENGDITDEGKPYLKLTGQNGNAFMILGLAQRSAKKAKWPQEKIDEYFNKAKTGDYDHLLQVTMEYFDVY